MPWCKNVTRTYHTRTMMYGHATVRALCSIISVGGGGEDGTVVTVVERSKVGRTKIRGAAKKEVGYTLDAVVDLLIC